MVLMNNIFIHLLHFKWSDLPLFNRKFCYVQNKTILSCENSEVLILEEATLHKSACSKDSVDWMKWDDIDTTNLIGHEVDREEVL